MREIHGEICGDVIAEAAGNVEITVDSLVIAVAEIRITAEFARRILGVDENRAAGRIPSEQRALRPLQNIHIRNVVKLEQRGSRRGDVDAIDIGGNRVFLPGPLDSRADTTNVRQEV